MSRSSCARLVRILGVAFALGCGGSGGGAADEGVGAGVGARAGEGGRGSEPTMQQAASGGDSAGDAGAGDAATASTSSLDAGANDCAAVPADQRLSCACVEYADSGMTPPEAVRETCDQLLARNCCSEGQVCLTGGGSGMAGGAPSTSSGECVARPAGCDSLSCACFEQDPCLAASLGVCGAALGLRPELSRTLSCHAQ